MDTTLQLLCLLFIKHFIVDFPLQTSFQYKNKGTYGHAGGVLHAALHGVGTYLCVLMFHPPAAYALGAFDYLIHYHIDWAKVKLNTRFGWGPTTHEQFWWLLGLDQFLHSLTYIGFVLILTKLTVL